MPHLLPPPGPLRVMAAATVVNTVGNGLFYTAAALFYTRSVGLSPAQVGSGLTLAGLGGLLVGIPAGHLADLRGARELLRVLLVAEALAMAGLVLVHSFAAFLLVVTCYVCLDKANNAVRQGLVASVFPAQDRVRGRAYLRSVTNLGLGAGAGLAGLAIALDTRTAYVCLVLADAVTFLLAAAVIGRLPRTAPSDRPEGAGGMLVALRDRPYLAVTCLSSLLALHYVLLEIALPLWVDRYTAAPTWTVAVLFLVNTTCCVLFQVRASRSSVDVRSSAVASRTGAVLVSLSCLVFAASAGRGAAGAVAVLVVGALVHVAGELLQAAGSWGLGFGLAREDRQGQYQGLYSTGFAASQMLGPLVITSTVIAWGRPGWLLMAAVFLVAGTALVPVARWADGSRAGRPV